MRRRIRTAAFPVHRHALPQFPGQIETDEQPHAGGTSASNFSTNGNNRATIRFTPSALGCIPSDWFNAGMVATSCRKNGS